MLAVDLYEVADVVVATGDNIQTLDEIDHDLLKHTGHDQSNQSDRAGTLGRLDSEFVQDGHNAKDPNEQLQNAAGKTQQGADAFDGQAPIGQRVECGKSPPDQPYQQPHGIRRRNHARQNPNGMNDLAMPVPERRYRRHEYICALHIEIGKPARQGCLSHLGVYDVLAGHDHQVDLLPLGVVLLLHTTKVARQPSIIVQVAGLIQSLPQRILERVNPGQELL